MAASPKRAAHDPDIELRLSTGDLPMQLCPVEKAVGTSGLGSSATRNTTVKQASQFISGHALFPLSNHTAAIKFRVFPCIFSEVFAPLQST
jgi:hypothetical protein